MSRLHQTPLWIAVLALLVSGCTTRRPPAPNPVHLVVVNGEEVAAPGSESLREVLQRKATAFRLGEQTPPAEWPLLVVDGVPMIDGLRSLDRIPALHVKRVTLLRAVQATPQYGPRAHYGAIIVTTR